MATAELLLPEAAASHLDQGNLFTHTVSISTADLNAGVKTDLPAIVEKEYFVLNTQSFIDLQIYLKAALKLPSSNENFEATYPHKLFTDYTSKDTKLPDLYTLMRNTLVGINRHCFDFSATTMGSMISLAGYIANFAAIAGPLSKELEGHLQKIFDSGSDVHNPAIKDSVSMAQDICMELGELAGKNNVRCQEFVTALNKFKLITGEDKTAIRIVNERSDLVLPDVDQLNASLKKSMDIAADTLSALSKTKNQATAKAKANGGVHWYYFVPWVGWGLAISDTVQKGDAERAIAGTQAAYDAVANQAGLNLSMALSFRSICSNLMSSIDNINDAIVKAEEALGNMAGAFSQLETGLSNVADNLDTVKGMVEKGSNFRMKTAFKRLVTAGNTWIKVADLAKQFQANGLLMEANVRKIEEIPEPPPILEILSANYGGADNTSYAKILFNEGEHLFVRSTEPGFPEPWEGQTKSISVLHKYGKERRIFVCKEYSGNHNLKAGPIAQSRDSTSVVNELQPFPKPANAPAQILAIVWGSNEVRDQAVYAYCYEKMSVSGWIQWRNENMGGDNWSSQVKSGTIYFTRDGGNTVHQCTGREWTDTAFTMS